LSTADHFGRCAIKSNKTINDESISMGPRLHVDPTRLYNKAVTAKIKKTASSGGPNINQEVSASLIGQLMFSFVLPVIFKTSTMQQIDFKIFPLVMQSSGVRMSFTPQSKSTITCG